MGQGARTPARLSANSHRARTDVRARRRYVEGRGRIPADRFLPTRTTPKRTTTSGWRWPGWSRLDEAPASSRKRSALDPRYRRCPRTTRPHALRQRRSDWRCQRVSRTDPPASPRWPKPTTTLGWFCSDGRLRRRAPGVPPRPGTEARLRARAPECQQLTEPCQVTRPTATLVIPHVSGDAGTEHRPSIRGVEALGFHADVERLHPQGRLPRARLQGADVLDAKDLYLLFICPTASSNL